MNMIWWWIVELLMWRQKIRREVRGGAGFVRVMSRTRCRWVVDMYIYIYITRAWQWRFMNTGSKDLMSECARQLSDWAWNRKPAAHEHASFRLPFLWVFAVFSFWDHRNDALYLDKKELFSFLQNTRFSRAPSEAPCIDDNSRLKTCGCLPCFCGLADFLMLKNVHNHTFCLWNYCNPFRGWFESSCRDWLVEKFPDLRESELWQPNKWFKGMS